MDSLAWTEIVRPGQPSAGAAFTRRVDGRAYEQVVSVRATVTTSAVVANRVPTVEFADGDGTVFASFRSATVIAAGTTDTVQWAYTGDHEATGDNAAGFDPLPGILLPSGYRINVTLSNLDAADQISDLALMILFRPTGPMAEPDGARPYSPQPTVALINYGE